MDLLSFNFDLIFVGIVVITISILGFIVLLNDYRSITNKTFFFFSFITVLYGVVNYAAYQVTDSDLALWLLRFTIFFSVWHAFSLFQIFYVFPSYEVSFPQWYRIILLPVVSIVSLLNLSPLVFTRITNEIKVGYVPNPERGPAIALFGAMTVFLVAGAIYLLAKKVIRAQGIDKKRLLIILIGTSITFSLLIIFNFILPVIFNVLTFIPYAPVFIFPFIAFTAYAIVKYKLFNVKVIATELITFSLWIFILVRTLISNSSQEVLINGFLFIVTVAVGILLIRSVIKEVTQKEQIEKLAEDLRRSYELEKKALVVEKQAKEELQNLDKTKNQFLVLIQHNLRTPLTSMRGYTDLILTGTFGKQSKKTTEVIKKLQLSTENLIKMVNDFLDITQFQLGKDVIAMKPGVQIESILEEIVADLKFNADNKGIYLKLEKPEKSLAVKADREKLKASLFNIIDNAIKYTPKGGVTVQMKNHGTAKIIISDTGIGMSPDNLKTLFTRMFERAEGAKKVAMLGSGIGLYLACQIIKSHRGKIWAESEGEGKGSTFHIELPLSDEANAPQESVDQPAIIKDL